MKTLLATALALALSPLATAQLSCTVTSCGTSCGPTLSVAYTPVGVNGNYTITMAAAGLHSQALCSLSWADNLQPVPIPLPGGCLVLIDPVWSELHTTSASGTFSFSRTWPHWATARYHMQMASIEIFPNNSFSVLTTECQTAACF